MCNGVAWFKESEAYQLQLKNESPFIGSWFGAKHSGAFYQVINEQSCAQYTTYLYSINRNPEAQRNWGAETQPYAYSALPEEEI